MKKAYYILNWNRDVKDVKKLATKLINGDIFVYTNQIDKWKTVGCITETMVADTSIAITKNMMLNHAIDNDYEVAIVVEDDLIIKDKKIIDKYINMMKKYDLPIIGYGYDNPINLILDTKPSPIMNIHDGQDKISINRTLGTSLVIFKIFKGMTMFNEDAKVMEMSIYLDELSNQGHWEFRGFVFDIFQSERAFCRLKTPTIRNKTKDLYEHDKKLHTFGKTNNVIDLIINYIKERRR